MVFEYHKWYLMQAQTKVAKTKILEVSEEGKDKR